MDRGEYFRQTTGRALYLSLVEALRQGADEADLIRIAAEVLIKARRAVKEAGIQTE